MFEIIIDQGEENVSGKYMNEYDKTTTQQGRKEDKKTKNKKEVDYKARVGLRKLKVRINKK